MAVAVSPYNLAMASFIVAICSSVKPRPVAANLSTRSLSVPWLTVSGRSRSSGMLIVVVFVSSPTLVVIVNEVFPSTLSAFFTSPSGERSVSQLIGAAVFPFT